MGGGKVRAVAVAPSVYAIEVAIRKTVEAYGDKIGKRGRKFLK
ncbi:MAG: hypothetical protein M0Z41_13540 [Peptococcaceae bacterium]|jgi:hypothetical protein|nr:hypothetical protein [Peptococcaceae bacterium]